MFKRSFLRFLAFLLIFALFTGCDSRISDKSSATSSIKQSSSLSLWAYDKGIEDELNKAFNKEYPTININVIFVPWSEYDNRFRLSLATGSDLPDIVKVESYWWGKWQNLNSTFDNLSNYGINPTDISPSMSNTIYSKQKEFIIVPVAIGIACFWYNKDVARKYLGTDNPETISNMLHNWNDLLDLGQLLKSKSEGNAFLFPDTMAIEELLIASNKNYIENDQIKLKENILPRFNLIQTMLRKGYIAKLLGTKQEKSYSENTVLFYPYADWHAQSIKNIDKEGKGRWGVVPPPGGIFYRGGNGYAIPKKSKSENKEAAAERIKFVLTPEGAKSVIETNQFSVYSKAFTNDILNRKDEYFNANIYKKFYDWSGKVLLKENYGLYDDVIQKELRVQAFNMMVDNISATKAIDNAINEIKTRLDND